MIMRWASSMTILENSLNWISSPFGMRSTFALAAACVAWTRSSKFGFSASAALIFARGLGGGEAPRVAYVDWNWSEVAILVKSHTSFLFASPMSAGIASTLDEPPTGWLNGTVLVLIWSLALPFWM